MLNVYAAKWCPHCTKTIEYLKTNQIEFKYIEIEEQPENIIQKIIEVNGGDDWVVPTLEFKGKWRIGKVFNEMELSFDLKQLGVK
jgi:mycoredoxin